MTSLFNGVHAVLYALFDADEGIDHKAMAAQVDHCIAKGCHGINVLGLATEVLKLTFAERVAVIDTVGAATRGRVSLSVTIAGNSVAEQVALIRAAESGGADWLILQPPMVGAYDAEVYLDFFARVAAATPQPVAVQNAPQYLGRALSAEDLARLSAHVPNLAAVKAEDAAAGIRRIVEVAGDGLAVLGGRGGQEMTECLRAGCHGFVLAPDIAPVGARIFDLWQAGAPDRAEALYRAAGPAIAFTMQSLEHLITYGKRIFAAQAGLIVHDRAPCLSTEASALESARHWANRLEQELARAR